MSGVDRRRPKRRFLFPGLRDLCVVFCASSSRLTVASSGRSSLRVTSLGACLVERVVDVPGDPEVVEQDRKLPGHRDRRPVLGARSAPCHDFQAPAPQIAVPPAGLQDVVARLHEQLAEQLVRRLDTDA